LLTHLMLLNVQAHPMIEEGNLTITFFEPI